MEIEIERKEINLNYSEKNELLFWKLFHNKYIRNYIFNQITVINKSIIDRTGCQIKKFKDITSLGWFIRNKELPLLKCKLERDDEKVVIEKYDIFILFNEILKYCTLDTNKYCKGKKEPLEDYKEFKDDENLKLISYFLDSYKKDQEYIEDDQGYLSNIESRIETKIFKLLLTYRLNEMMGFKLIDIVMGMQKYYQCDSVYENSILNQLLFNEPYCNLIRIDEKTIELVIKNSRSTTLLNKLLLNLKNRGIYDTVISDNVKNKSISWVSCMKYEEHQNEMYEFILNDESLYNTPNNIIEQISAPNSKRLKSSKSTYISTSTTTNNEDDKVALRINVNHLFNINSPIIQNKLLKLNYFGIVKEIDYSEEFIGKILKLLNNNEESGCNDFTDNGNNDIKQRIIDLIQLFSVFKIKRANFIYFNFLLNYEEPIDELSDMVVWRFTLFSKSLNILKYLLSKYKDDFEPIKKKIDNFHGFSYNYKKEKKFKNSNENLKFIQLYTTNYHYFPEESRHCNNKLLEFIFSIQSNQEYEMVVNNSIVRTNENKQLTDLIPEKWFDIPIEIKNKLVNFKNGFLIQDTNTIDIIFNGFSFIQSFYNSLQFEKDKKLLFFKYETYKLIDYAKLIDGISSSYYIYPFTVAINNCDIDSLKHIDQLLNNSVDQNKSINIKKFEYYNAIGGSNYSKFVRSKIQEANSIKYSNQVKINFNNNDEIILNNNQINQVLDYFNSTCYKLFSSKLFIKFVKDLSKLPNSMDLKLNFESFQNEWFKLFLKSLTNDISSNFIQFLLNNYNPFKSIELLPTVEKIIDKWRHVCQGLNDKSFFNFNELGYIYECFSISCLYYTNFYEDDNYSIPFCCYSYESSFEIISTIKLILNQVSLIKHCYNKSTTSSSANIELIKIYDIFQFIINHLFKRLIKVHKVTEHQIQQIYQHIKSTWLSITNNDFIFEHSQYHVFFYLGIRSIDFMNCLMDLSYIINESKSEYHSIGTESQNLLDPTIFTFDYIFNYSYDDVFKLLESNIEANGVGIDGSDSSLIDNDENSDIDDEGL